MMLKTTNFLAYLLIILFCVINFDLAVCLKCKFVISDGYYLCNVIKDSSSIEEDHLEGKTDDDVGKIRFNGTIEESTPLCQRFKNLKKIDIFEKNSVEVNLFKQCENLKEAGISFTEIKEIPEKLFFELSQLTHIFLGKNKLSTLQEDVFVNQKELEHLFLERNQISTLPSDIFKSLTKLQQLELSGNKIQSLNPKWFETIQSLTSLDLDFNEIHELPKNVFTKLEKLEWLDLEGNQLTTVHSDSFGIHRDLDSINLFDNKINAFDEKLIENTAVKFLNMNGNVCIDEYINVYEMSEIKEELSNCIKNYQPREDQI